MTTDSNITHVTDTALWVAHFRALESDRPNAAFRDPLAKVLVGERGERIAKAMPYGKMMEWYMVMRTVAIDALVKRALSLGADTVINLGAGLDTRPYRMELPASLQWIEVDFPQMIRYKTDKLKNEKPICQLEFIEADLSDVPARQAILERLGAKSQKALIITEGVIPYLTADDAASLSRALFAIPSFKFWIQDYRQGGLRRTSGRMKRVLKDSPFKFDIVDSLGFFEQHGWKILEKRLAVDESLRIKRSFPFMFPWSLIIPFLSQKTKLRYRNATGFVMYEKP